MAGHAGDLDQQETTMNLKTSLISAVAALVLSTVAVGSAVGPAAVASVSSAVVSQNA